MTVTELADTLYEECVAEGSTSFVDSILAAARAALLAGSGSVGTVNNGSVNGKSFSITVSLSPAETLKACRMAINRFNGTEAPMVTVPDWSRTIGGGW